MRKAAITSSPSGYSARTRLATVDGLASIMVHAVECRKKRGSVWALRHCAAHASNPACWQRLVRSADCPSEAGMGATHIDEVADGIYRINTTVEIPDGEPATLACMHGSAWRGDGAALLGALAGALTAEDAGFSTT